MTRMESRWREIMGVEYIIHAAVYNLVHEEIESTALD